MTATSLKLNGLNFSDIVQLKGGRNNKVFRAKGISGDVIIKQYFFNPSDTRDRLLSEFSMLNYLWQNGIKNIPEPLFSDSDTHTGIYKFIDGVPVEPDIISEQDIISLSEFLTVMWNLRTSSNTVNLPIASEACFSIKDYFSKVDKRFSQFQQVKTGDLIVSKALQFLNNYLYPLFKKIILHAESKSIFAKFLEPSCRTLSPSDYGFHNAIRSKKGLLYFIDFEYAGWDDPVKMICDALLQPDKPIPERFYSAFLNHGKAILHSIDNLLDRAESLYPLLGIKWCLIMLNEFLPVSESRRQFAGEKIDNELRELQLYRSTNLYNKIKMHFEQDYISSLIKSST